MESSLHPKKKIPSYVLVSIALVQSELCWFCSVLYCIFRESGLLNEQASVFTAKRNRSNSAPTSATSFTKEDFITLDDEQDDEDEEGMQTQRRFSLPIETMNIRDRPSIKDEQVGTTCPPVLWQKLRVKLGRPPVHGDPKPKSILSSSSSISLTPPTVISFVELSPNTTIQRIDSVSPSISSKSMKESPCSSPSPSEVDKKSSPSSILSISKSSTNSSVLEESSNISISSQKRSVKKKIVSKLNSAFHLHRSRSSNDLKSKTL